MSGKTAAIIGSTGMIGSYLLDQLVNDPYYETIRVIVRRPFSKTNSKIEVKLVDFDNYESLKLSIDGSDVLFCAIGTTQKNVKGDKELYRKIDLDIPSKAARACKETGCEKMVMVSSVGANSKSRSFYLKLKGETEEAIEKTGINSIHFMQPSMLLGERKEKRAAEKIFQGIMKSSSFLLNGFLRKYRAVHGRDVAKAMLQASKTNTKGVCRYTYDEIKTFSR